MYIVTKNGTTRAVRDNNQLAAFLNNGWVILDKKVKEEPKVEIKEEPKEEVKEEPKEEVKEESKLTKEDIEKMPYLKARALAKEMGIPVNGRKSNEIKEDLIARL